MVDETNILKELGGISPLLATLHGKNVFTVPEGYFDHVTERVQEKVLTDSFDKGIDKNHPVQTVPAGYFNTLGSAIIKKINAEDENADELPSVLKNIGHKNPFSAPDGYFDGFPAMVLARTSEKSPAKVVSFQRPWLRYLAAAAVAVVVFSGIFYLKSDFSAKDSFAIVNKHTVFDKAALKYHSQKDFDNGIAALSDQQIIAYLEDHGTLSANPDLQQDADTTGMPEPTEYLLKDDALENYLNLISSVSPEHQDHN